MVSVYSLDTRFQEGNRFPHPVSVHKLPRYQPDELFPHWGAMAAFYVIERQTSAFSAQLTPAGWHTTTPKTARPLRGEKNFFTHKVSWVAIVQLLKGEALTEQQSSSFHQRLGSTAIGAIYRTNNIQTPFPDQVTKEEAALSWHLDAKARYKRRDLFSLSMDN